MKNKGIRRSGMWILCALVLAGLSYSASVLAPSSVYAASCNCTEEKQDAEQFCYQNFGSQTLDVFQCPYNYDGGNYYLVVCDADPAHQGRPIACD